MAQPHVLILRAPGTNCDQETAFAFEQAGAAASLVHINRVLEDPRLMQPFQILCLPGGFSYGDDLAAGRILGNQIRCHLNQAMAEFKDAGKLILGICNGFQVLLKSEILLSADESSGSTATLAWNASGKFEDRWVDLAADQDHCVFLKGVERLYLPIAHAEGRFVTRNANVFEHLHRRRQLALRYADPQGSSNGQPLSYPINPNGSEGNVAGVCDETGRVLGLMPHPERHIDPTHHPRWTRLPGREKGDGLAVFENAVAFFKD